MTPDDVRTILARAEAATEGPWEINNTVSSSNATQTWPTTYVLPPKYVPEDNQEIAEIHSDSIRLSTEASSNARFIAHARTDVPNMGVALLEMLEFHEWRKVREAPGFVDAELEEFRKTREK